MGDRRAIEAMLKLHWQVYYSNSEAGESADTSSISARSRRKSSNGKSPHQKWEDKTSKSKRFSSPNALIDTKEIYAIYKNRKSNEKTGDFFTSDFSSDSESVTTLLKEPFRTPGYKYQSSRSRRSRKGRMSMNRDSKTRLSSAFTPIRDKTPLTLKRSKSSISFCLSDQPISQDDTPPSLTDQTTTDSPSTSKMPKPTVESASDSDGSSEESDSDTGRENFIRRESTGVIRRRSNYSINHKQTPPIFYASQGNNSAIIVAPLEALGWKRTTDRYFEGYRLKWTEGKNSIDYNAFREGDQMVNHIPNYELITNKLGLLLSLREYERVTWSVKSRPPRLQMKDFVPDTFIIDHKADRDMFFLSHKEGDIWIYKPTGLNQGIGITLIRDVEEFKQELSLREEKLKQRCRHSRRPMEKIIQRYIHNPLLLNGHKFDIRCYMLIASTSPFMVLFRHGYVRLSMHQYSKNSSNMIVHLTNQYIQKKDPNYEKSKNNTVWSMDALNNYINDNYAGEKIVEKNWVKNYLSRQIQRIMLHIFHSVKHKLMNRTGYFEVYGYDFMIDENFKVWLIEINSNPALTTNCPVLNDVIPAMITEALYLSIECFEKKRKRQPILPLSNQDKFVLIYDGSRAPNAPTVARNINIQWEAVAPRYRNIPKPETPITERQPKPTLTPFVAGGHSDFCGRFPNSLSTPNSARTSNSTAKVVDKSFEHTLRRYDKLDSPLKSARKLSPIFKSNESSEKDSNTIKWITNRLSNLPLAQQPPKKTEEERIISNDPLDDIIPKAVTPDSAYPVPEKCNDYISDFGIANISTRLAKRECISEAHRQLLQECVRDSQPVLYSYKTPTNNTKSDEKINSSTYLSTAPTKETLPLSNPAQSQEKFSIQPTINSTSSRLLRTAPISSVRVLTPHEDTVRLKLSERPPIKIRKPSPNRSS